MARTGDVVRLMESPLVQSHISSLSAERLMTWRSLQHICSQEEANALQLPDVKSNGSNLQQFLDVLQGLSSRRDVLAMLLTMSACERTERVDKGNLIDESWQSQFLAERIKWHMIQEDFLHLCGGITPVVESGQDVIPLVEEAALNIHEMCVGEFGTAPRVEIDADCNVLPFCGVPDQIRYIITELLKNAAVASVQSGNLQHPIRVQVISDYPCDALPDSTGVSFAVKITDGAGGVPPLALQNMWRLGWSGQNTQRRIAGFGVGLPLAGIYSGLFGGRVVASSTSGDVPPGTTFTLAHPTVGIESL